jgi:hypothetical protein
MSITPTQSLNVTIGVNGGSGNPTPTGTVTQSSGSYSSAATTLQNGSVTIGIPAGSLAAGDNTLLATYIPDAAGSSAYESAENVAVVTVTGLAAPVFSPAAGTYAAAQTVTISDSTPGATIYYTANGTTPTTSSTQYSGAITVSSTETLEAIATATGYTASAVATAAYSINLPPPSFSIAGTAVSVAPGATTGNTSTITVTPSNGYTGTVNLSCAITPSAASDPATCSIPAEVTITGATAQTATLSVYTTAATALNQPMRRLWPSAGGAVLALAFFVGVRARRRNWRAMVGLLVLLAAIAGIGCGSGGGGGGGDGGGGGGGGTATGTYTITVTGTSGTTTAMGTVALTVR